MRGFRSLALILCIFLGLGSALAQPARVGTFDKASIVVAFYRSSLWAETLKTRQVELEAAQKANDQARIKELNAWGEQSQELAHQQLAGQAPITNILEALKAAFEEIQRTANVSAVVPSSDAPEIPQSIDVTDKLLDWLKADENTRRVIRELQHK